MSFHPQGRLRAQGRRGRAPGRRHAVPALAARAGGLPRQAHRAARLLGAGRAGPRPLCAARRRRLEDAHLRAGARARAGASAQYLLRKELSPERPLVVLSGNDLEHALLHLGAMYAGIPYAPISPAYSLLSTDFGKLRAIFELLTPGLAFAKGEQFGRALKAAARCEVIHALQEPEATPAVDEAHAPRRARHHRQVPLHLGLDRHAEGGDQHPAHVVREPGDDPRHAALLRRRAAGARRLGAVAPHRRRQPRLRPGALQRRLVLHRRRPADARRHRDHGAQPARDRADVVLQRAEGLRGFIAVSQERCRC